MTALVLCVLLGADDGGTPLKVATPKPPRELLTVEGVPSLMAFIDKEQVGVRQGKRFWAWSLPAPLNGDVGDAFAVPGRLDQIIVCMKKEPKRECVWLSPRCEAGALLAGKYSRVERDGDKLFGEVAGKRIELEPRSCEAPAPK